jgi:chitinase
LGKERRERGIECETRSTLTLSSTKTRQALLLLTFVLGGCSGAEAGGPGVAGVGSAGSSGSGSSGGISATGGSGGNTAAGAAANSGGEAGSAGGSAGSSNPGGAGGSGGLPPLSSQRVVGYLPVWRGLADYAPNLASAGLTHVNLGFANPESGTTPALGASDADIALFVNAAHAAGTQVLISIGGASGGAVTALLAAGDGQAFADALAQYIEVHGFDGLDVDIEGEGATTAEYAAFVAAAGAALKPDGKLLTAALATWFAGDVADSALADFDFINLMSYDHCGPWTDACEQSTYAAALADLDHFTADRGIAPERMVLGVPFYAWCWGASCPEEALTYGALLEQYPEAWQQDWIEGDGLALSYNGRQTILDKVELAQQYGGVMAWELGQDAAGEQSLLRAITDNL